MDAQITVRNFRSIKEATFPIREGLNVIVGANGSGKTNLLHALKFLSNVVTSGASLAMAKAGGASRNFRRGSTTIQFSVETPLDVSLYCGKQALFTFRWEMSVGPSGADGFVQVKNEAFRIFAHANEGWKEKEVFALEVSRGANNATKGKLSMDSEQNLTKRLFDSSLWVSRSSKKQEIFTTLRARLNDVLAGARKKPQDASLLEQVSNIHYGARRFFRDLLTLDEFNISPDVARQGVDPLPVIRMGPDGSGLSEVIGALETDQLRRLQDRIAIGVGSPYFSAYPYDMHWAGRPRKNPLPDIVENLQAAVSSIDSLATEIDPSTGRRYVVFKSGGHKFRPQEISDGTFKWLCLLIALFVPTSRVILLEEPENFMHPWMQQRFVALARAQAKRGSGSVVLSTHSVTVLNALNVDELCVAYQENGETHIEPIENGDEIQALLAKSSFGLGDIWVSGEFGGVTGGN